MELLASILGFLSLVLHAKSAQADLQEEILATVAYVMYGDRTPLILPQTPVLTPLGAQQLYDLGTQFQNRYLVPSTTGTDGVETQIFDVSPYQLSVNDINILTTDDQFNIASAQAFFQGLYPPLVTSSGYVDIDGQSLLANGTNIVAPLNGYQYPQIISVSTLDLNSIYIQGMDECPARDASVSEYYATSSYADLEQSSQPFYNSLKANILEGIFIDGSIGYYDAYAIWEYLNYVSLHNVTASQYVTDEVLAQARGLADEWVYNLYGDLSALSLTGQSGIRAIAGSTFANKVIQLFETNIDTEGQYGKMNLLFGSYETMASFASLAQLASSSQPQFGGLPDTGSTMVFELFSLYVEQDGIYPDRSNMYVRFLFQNGTDGELIGYPLFGRPNSEIIMSLDDFETGMESIQTVSIENWCSTCNSYSIFCPAFDDDGTEDTPSGSGILSPSGKHSLSPVVAGVIGAVIALALVGLILAILVVFVGVRCFRRNRRRSELGGFKGAEKLASDQDLTIPKSAAGATVAAVEAAPPRGHERVGSWELHDQAKNEEAQLPTMPSRPFTARRPSYEDDILNVNAYNKPVRPRDSV